jgi:nucleotide-binding universal stress UspA family protein
MLRPMYRRIVLAYDGSVDGQEALRQGMDLATLCSAEVRLLAVVDPSLDFVAAEAASIAIQEQQRSTNQILQLGLDQLKARGLKAEAEVGFGDPAKEISRFAVSFQADLIVLGHREQSAWTRWWTGSVGAAVLVHAPCSLLVAIPTMLDDAGSATRCKVESFEKHARKRYPRKASKSSDGGGAA